MTKFDLGDRVRRRTSKLKGTCISVLESRPRIQWDTGSRFSIHPELLIKLKKKAPVIPIPGRWVRAEEAHPCATCFVPDFQEFSMSGKGEITFKEAKK